MSPWWTETTGTWLGSLGGAVLGVTCGVFGALVGTLSPRGIARRAILTSHVCLLGIGILMALAAVVALVTSQPYHVWYPLALMGGMLTLVLGILLPVVRRRYAEAEARRLAEAAAQD